MDRKDEWVIRAGEKLYPAASRQMVHDWYQEGRIPSDALIFHASLGSWKTPAELFGPTLSGNPVETTEKSLDEQFEEISAQATPSSSESEGDTNRGDWMVSFGDKQYPARDLEMIRDWYRSGRIPKTANVYFPALREWKPVAQLFESDKGPTAATAVAPPAQGTRSTSVGLITVFAVLCFIVLAALISMAFDSKRTASNAELAASVKKQVDPRLQEADRYLLSNQAAAARDAYAAVKAMIDGSKVEGAALAGDRARASAGHASAGALLGNSDEATAEFLELLRSGAGVSLVSKEASVTTAFETAQLQHQQQREMAATIAREKSHREFQSQKDNETRGSEPNDSDIRIAVSFWASSNFNDDDIEFLKVYPPQQQGEFWVARVDLRAKNRMGAKIVKGVTFYLQDGKVVRAVE